MSYRSSIRAMQSAERRQQRDAQRRSRELDRQAKEQAKLSALEQARLEVEIFENRLDVLLSIHKEHGETWDWVAVAASLPPPLPKRHCRQEWRARQCNAVLPAEQKEDSQYLIEQARLRDEEEYQKALEAHSQKVAELEKLKHLAQRILNGEHKAFTETLLALNPFAEMSDLGSAINFTVHTARLVECVVNVNGKQAIPNEFKTLTQSGKVSTRPIPKGRFHEIYQDYVCGCVLRIAREVFALFPVDTVLVTATIESVAPQTGHTVEIPVLSVSIPRVVIAKLDFNLIGPYYAMDNFQHRGDLKASRKAESFLAIEPLTPGDIEKISLEVLGTHNLVARIQRLREEIKAEISHLSLSPLTANSQISPVV